MVFTHIRMRSSISLHQAMSLHYLFWLSCAPWHYHYCYTKTCMHVYMTSYHICNTTHNITYSRCLRFDKEALAEHTALIPSGPRLFQDRLQIERPTINTQCSCRMTGDWWHCGTQSGDTWGGYKWRRRELIVSLKQWWLESLWHPGADYDIAPPPPPHPAWLHSLPLASGIQLRFFSGRSREGGRLGYTPPSPASMVHIIMQPSISTIDSFFALFIHVHAWYRSGKCTV